MNIRRVLLSCFIVACVFSGGPIWAQEDPATSPVPDFADAFLDERRALVVQALIESNNTAQLTDVFVSEAPPSANVGNPAMILVEWFDSTGDLMGSMNAWDPRWEHQQTDLGERMEIQPSGLGSFDIPFDHAIASVRISDQEVAQELTTIVVADVVEDFCVQNPEDPECEGFGSNQAPTANAGGPYSVVEGGSVALDGSESRDVDGDDLTFAWDLDGDGVLGETGSDAERGDEIGSNPTLSAVGMDGPSIHMVDLKVCDPGNLCDRAEGTLEVQNAPPSINAIAGDTSNEGSEATVSASFTDSGLPDTHIATIDWDDGNAAESVAVTQGTGGGSLSSEHSYGDDGNYTVTVAVTDDDGGVTSATADVAVSNLLPDVTLDVADAIEFPGGSAFLGESGVTQEHDASAEDPGSDDLTFSWNFGPVTTYFNNTGDPSGSPDPFPSPGGTFPFAVSDGATATFEVPGVHTVEVTVTDDDGGSAADELLVLVVDSQACVAGVGFWDHQFGGKGNQHIDDETLQAYLAIVNIVSAVFSEEVSAETVEEAREVLSRVQGADSPDGADMVRSEAARQTLTVWLNFAKGAVAWDQAVIEEVVGGETSTLTFAEVISDIEEILIDPDATQVGLEYAKDQAEMLNELDEQNDACDG